MDSLEFLETLRKDWKSDIPIIVSTGKGREEVAIEALNLGQIETSRKPVTRNPNPGSCLKRLNKK